MARVHERRRRPDRVSAIDREARHEPAVRLQGVDVVVVRAEDDVELSRAGDVADRGRRKDRIGIVVRSASPRVESPARPEHETHLPARIERFESTLLVWSPKRARAHDYRRGSVRAVEISHGRTRVDRRGCRAVDVHELRPARQLSTRPRVDDRDFARQRCENDGLHTVDRRHDRGAHPYRAEVSHGPDRAPEIVALGKARPSGVVLGAAGSHAGPGLGGRDGQDGDKARSRQARPQATMRGRPVTHATMADAAGCHGSIIEDCHYQ